MLKIFRKKMVSKFILWGLLILILPAFVMWGGANLSRGKDKAATHVGFINNRRISFDELYQAMSGVRSQIILNYFNQPKALDALLGNRKLLAKLGWDRIIMLDEAKKSNIRVSDKEIIDYIRSHPLFVRNNVFDDKFYTYMLHNSLGLEPRNFEEAVRENIAIQKLGSVLTKDLKVSDTEVADEYKKEFEHIKIAYFIITPKSAIDRVKLDENALRDFYDKHKSELIIKSNLKGAIPDRQATFEESKESIENHLKETEARIIISKDAEDIYKKLVARVENKGDAFGKAASSLGFEVKNSQFLSRGDNLEDIGPVSRVIDSSSNLKDFEISKPMEVKDGYIIFEIVGRQGIESEKFKEEKEEYTKKVRERRSNVIMEEWLRKLEDKTKLAINLEEIEKYYR